MIADATTVATLQTEWSGVVKLRERMQKVVTFAFAGGTPSSATGVLYNLPMLLAFDVLRQVLRAARKEGVFGCNGGDLGPLLDCAKTHVPWLDWDEMRAGVRRRNEIAHDGMLFEAKQCLADIEQVEKQLAAWAVIPSA